MAFNYIKFLYQCSFLSFLKEIFTKCINFLYFHEIKAEGKYIKLLEDGDYTFFALLFPHSTSSSQLHSRNNLLN